MLHFLKKFPFGSESHSKLLFHLEKSISKALFTVCCITSYAPTSSIDAFVALSMLQMLMESGCPKDATIFSLYVFSAAEHAVLIHAITMHRKFHLEGRLKQSFKKNKMLNNLFARSFPEFQSFRVSEFHFFHNLIVLIIVASCFEHKFYAIECGNLLLSKECNFM